MRSKVALLRCEDYDLNCVIDKIREGIDLIGGIDKFINGNEKILLKPNILAGREPKRAVTTHPVIFEAILKILLENGNKVIYGDSPGYDKPASGLKKAGITEVAEKYNIKQGDFDKGRLIKIEKPIIAEEFNIANAVFESDGIISLPKMKSHQLTRITGAVKNQFGCIYGFNKAMYHVKLPNGENFCKMLIDLNKFLKPRLYIMDGIEAMEGNGPSSGNPTKMNVIIISSDPIAMDATFCRIVNLNPEFISTNIYGREFGLGTYINEEIEYYGEPLENFLNKKFSVVRKPIKPMMELKILKPIERFISRKPAVNKGLCIKCGVCIEACPVEPKAINFIKDKKSPPQYDYKKCIRCYCCQEVCPYKAIYVKTPLIGKIIIR